MSLDSKGNKIAGLWNGGVSENARKLSVGSAMAAMRVEDAKIMGAKIITCYLLPEGIARPTAIS